MKCIKLNGNTYALLCFYLIKINKKIKWYKSFVLGTIMGYILGSIFSFDTIKIKELPFFQKVVRLQMIQF